MSYEETVLGIECVFFCITFIRNIFARINISQIMPEICEDTHLGLRIKYSYFCSILIEIEMYRQI
jgi:hypothetical protein